VTEDDKPAPPKPQTGTGRMSKTGNGQMTEAALKDRFPALRHRAKARPNRPRCRKSSIRM